MVLIRFYRDEAGRLAEFEATGHALFDFAGKDIVCAAVSALLQAAILGLEDCIEARPQYTRARGRVKCTVPPESREGEVGRQVAAVLETIFASLQSVAIQYPGNLRVDDMPMGTVTPLQARPTRRPRAFLGAANRSHGRSHPKHGG